MCDERIFGGLAIRLPSLQPSYGDTVAQRSKGKHLASNALRYEVGPAQGNAWSPGTASARPHAAAVKELSWSSCATPDFIDVWDALAQRSAEPNPFHESWFLLPSLRALDSAASVSLLVVRGQGELAGIMPIRREARYYGKPLPHLANWIHPNSFLGTPLVADGLEHAFWRGLLKWSDQTSGQGLFLHLAGLPLHGKLHDALRDVLQEQARRSGIVYRESRAMLATDQTPDEFFHASMSSKARSELRRKQARLGEMGKLAFEWHFDSAGIEQWSDQFLALEASGWKGASKTALASCPQTAALFREAMAGCAARGKLQRLSLKLDGRPIAMLTSFLSSPGAFGFKIAFDEEFSRYSPGVLLQRENLRILERGDIAWSDSCAGADNKMISQLWPQRREIGRISIAIGGRLRRALFTGLLSAELRRNSSRT
jgi:CelD/BcsL family acetyltransferase involved in cellulose biosynthesis